MAKKHLTAWGLGIVLCLVILTTQVNVHVARPVVINTSGNLKDIDIDGIVKENIPDIKLNEPSGPGPVRLTLVMLILGWLTWYTMKKN